jgi:hypothetical protein
MYGNEVVSTFWISPMALGRSARPSDRDVWTLREGHPLRNVTGQNSSHKLLIYGLGSIYVAADEATRRLEWDGDILLEDVWERGSVHLLDIANGIRHCATQFTRSLPRSHTSSSRMSPSHSRRRVASSAATYIDPRPKISPMALGIVRHSLQGLFVWKKKEKVRVKGYNF